MHKILIVEDNPIQCSTTKQIIEKKYPSWTIDAVTTFEEGMIRLKQSLGDDKKYTLFLLDVQLSPESSNRGGFLLADEIRKHSAYYRTPILFLTAISNEGNIALSQYHCYNYMVKPFTESDILFQLEQMLLTGYMQDTMDLTDTGRIHHKVFVNEICAIESIAHAIIVHLETDTFITREYTLKQILRLLPSTFVQCHRRFVINKHYIKNYDLSGKYIQICSLHVPIGKTYISTIQSLLQD